MLSPLAVNTAGSAAGIFNQKIILLLHFKGENVVVNMQIFLIQKTLCPLFYTNKAAFILMKDELLANLSMSIWPNINLQLNLIN